MLTEAYIIYDQLTIILELAFVYLRPPFNPFLLKL
jgi:hypothetical protein